MPLTPEQEEQERIRKELEGAAAAVPTAEPVPSQAATTTAAPATAAPSTAPLTATAPTGFEVAPSHVPPPPRPPEPPPPPPNVQDLAGDVGAFARNWLETPNRYLGDLATATREAGEARLTAAESDATRDIEEWAASRGLIGSSLEGEEMVRLQDALRRARGDEERQLLEMLATSESMDRERAGRLGLDVSQLSTSTSIAERQLDLEAQRLQQEAQLSGRSLDITEANNQAQINIRAQELAQEAQTSGRSLDLQEARDQATREVALEQIGISQQEVDLRAQQLQQEAQTSGRSLDLQEARDQASTELAREQMEHEIRLQGSQIAQRESEFARSMNLNEREFGAQQDQFSLQYGEQVASRLQQDEQFRATLESGDARFALDVGLRERALDLQLQGMEMDEAFRQSALAQERELTERAQALQQEGMNLEDAYRYAALEQDSRFREGWTDDKGEYHPGTLALQELGMDQDQAYRQAELEFQKERLEQQNTQFMSELEFRMDQAETEQERFDAMIELWRKYYGLPDADNGGGDGGGAGPTGDNNIAPPPELPDDEIEE